jgi:hypothetical protein
VLGPAFDSGGPTTDDLRRVQRRGELATRITQGFQVNVLRDLYPRSGADRPGAAGADPPAPIPLRRLRRFPPIRHLTGRFIGIGVRPERARTAAVAPLDASGDRR